MLHLKQNQIVSSSQYQAVYVLYKTYDQQILFYKKNLMGLGTIKLRTYEESENKRMKHIVQWIVFIFDIAEPVRVHLPESHNTVVTNETAIALITHVSAILYYKIILKTFSLSIHLFLRNEKYISFN